VNDLTFKDSKYGNYGFSDKDIGEKILFKYEHERFCNFLGNLSKQRRSISPKTRKREKEKRTNCNITPSQYFYMF
jgi:hypothetical protein